MVSDLIWFGMVFHKDALENEKLVLKRSILGLGRVMYLDVARMLEQIKSCLRYWGARFLYALNTNTALLNKSFSLSGSIKRETDRQTEKTNVWDRTREDRDTHGRTKDRRRREKGEGRRQNKRETQRITKDRRRREKGEGRRQNKRETHRITKDRRRREKGEGRRQNKRETQRITKDRRRREKGEGRGQNKRETQRITKDRRRRERDRERDRDRRKKRSNRERGRERQTETETDKERETERQTDREKEEEREKERRGGRKEEKEKKHIRHILCYKMCKSLHGMKHHTQSQSTFTFCLSKPYQPFSQTRTSTTHNQTTFWLSLYLLSYFTQLTELRAEFHLAIQNFSLALIEAGIINSTQYTTTHTGARAATDKRTSTNTHTHTHTHTHVRVCAQTHLRAGTHKQTRACARTRTNRHNEERER